MNSKYYIFLFVIALLTHFILSSLAIACGMFYGSYSYALGSAIGTPPLWFIAIGAALLMRPYVYARTCDEDDYEALETENETETDDEGDSAPQKFNNGFAAFLLIIGILWFIVGTVLPWLTFAHL